MKRGQINQVFGYLTAIIVIGMVFALAYTGINNVLERSVENKLSSLEQDLTYYVQTFSYDYGSSSRVRFTFPSSVDAVYLIDYNGLKDNITNICEGLNYCEGVESIQLPFVIRDDAIASALNQTDNPNSIYFVGEGYFHAFAAGNIYLDGDSYKMVAVDQPVELEFQGLVDQTKITVTSNG